MLRPLVTYWRGGKEIWSQKAKEILGWRDLASTRNSSRPHPETALQPWSGGQAAILFPDRWRGDERGQLAFQSKCWLWSQQRMEGGASPSPPLPLFLQSSFCFLGFSLYIFEGNIVVGRKQIESMKWCRGMATEGNGNFRGLGPFWTQESVNKEMKIAQFLFKSV